MKNTAKVILKIILFVVYTFLQLCSIAMVIMVIETDRIFPYIFSPLILLLIVLVLSAYFKLSHPKLGILNAE